jgi:hypothetical protein
MYLESSIWYQATTRQCLISFNLRLAIFASFDFGYFLISSDKTIPSKMVEADLTSWTKEFYFYSKYVNEKLDPDRT